MSKNKRRESLSDAIDSQQRRSFLKFINYQLLEYNRQITSLEDLSTGVDLFYLLKSLLNKKGKDFKIFHKLETKRIETSVVQNTNCQVLLEYLTKVEKIQLYGITGPSIVGKDIKSILGLLWRIIRHFFMDEDGEMGGMKGGKKGMAKPYNEIVEWMNSIFINKEYKLEGMGDWKTGRPFFELLRSFLFLSRYGNEEEKMFFEKYANYKGEELIKECIEIAHKKYNVPKILEVADFMNPEKLSLCTYMNFFRQAKKKVKLYEEKMVTLEENYKLIMKKELEKLDATKEEEKKKIIEDYEKKIEDTIKDYEKQLMEKQEEMDKQKESYETILKEKDEILNSSLNEKEKELNDQVKAKQEEINLKIEELATLNKEWEGKLAEKEKEFNEMKTTKEEEIANLGASKDKEFAELKKQKEDELDSKMKEHEEIIKDEKDTANNNLKAETDKWVKKMEEKQAEILELNEQLKNCRCVIQ